MRTVKDCRDLNCPAHGRYLRRIRQLQLALARERARERILDGRLYAATRTRKDGDE